MAIKTPQGLVVMVGCSHPGIEKILEAASKIDARIYTVFGGFHLVDIPDAEVSSMVTRFRDKWKLERSAPGHCTGEPTFTALHKAFGDRYLYAGLGTTLSMGANPRAASNQDGARVLHDGDSRSYRTLLARSDDLHETGVSVVQLARIR